MTTGERIKLCRKELGMSAEQLAEKVQLSPATIYRYEKGDIEKVPSDIINKIARALNSSPAYLMGWETKKKKVPIYGEVRAGLPTSTDENIEGWEEIYPHYKDSTAYAFLKIKGNSMLPRMQEGDLALVDTEAQVENGDLAVVLVNGNEATIKKVYIDSEGITLHAFNPYYPDIHYTPKEVEDLPVRFFGKVVETRARY